MRIFEELNIDFLGKRKIFYVVSAVLFIIGIIAILLGGIKLGIDFKGGTEVALQFEKPIEIGEIRNIAENLGLGNVEVKTFGGEKGVLLRTELQEIPEDLYPRVKANIEDGINKVYKNVPYRIVDSSLGSITYEFANADTANTVMERMYGAGYQTGRALEDPNGTKMLVRVGISDWIKESLRERLPDNSFKVLKEEKVGPKIGKELKTDAVLAILLSLVVILIYLGFRFKFVFALGAVAALFHDVLITLGLYALLYDAVPGLNLEISITVVAAFLTLVGYSINDTVVVFDRVREFLKIHKTAPIEENINKAINKTMSRTILTSGTTLISVGILLFFGGEVLRTFAVTLFFGIIIGTYSSIFVASALVLEYAKRNKKKVQF